MGPMVTEFGAQGLPDVKSLKKFIPIKNYGHPTGIAGSTIIPDDQTFLIAQIIRENQSVILSIIHRNISLN